jgi:hypothetical protein
MKKIVRLNETQLTNMIRRVISEISTTTTSKPPKLIGGGSGLCTGGHYTVTYNSSDGTPTYNCNSMGGYCVNAAATAANGILTCSCCRGARK